MPPVNSDINETYSTIPQSKKKAGQYLHYIGSILPQYIAISFNDIRASYIWVTLMNK